jgi:hypothetical protein
MLTAGPAGSSQIGSPLGEGRAEWIALTGSAECRDCDGGANVVMPPARSLPRRHQAGRLK